MQLAGLDVFEKRGRRIDEQVDSLGEQLGHCRSASTERYGLNFDLCALRKVRSHEMLNRTLADRATQQGHRPATRHTDQVSNAFDRMLGVGNHDKWILSRLADEREVIDRVIRQCL